MKSKAIFLLTVFLLNTIVGFSCAMAMKNDAYHHSHSHKHLAVHDHNHGTANEQLAEVALGVSLSDEDPCCKNLVNDLVTQSKMVPDGIKVQFALPVTILPEFSYTFLISLLGIPTHKAVNVDQRERPPNQEIRIVIQSFQI